MKVSRRRVGIVFATAAVAILGYYISFLIIETASPYTPISDITDRPENFQGKMVEILGTVESIDLSRRTFVVIDENSSLTVTFGQVPVPQGLGEGRKVWIHGIVSGATLKAVEIRVECPSK